ncbi:bestrophin-like domain [Bosea rubneri]|uniref:DUF4239 domain-containing protein n=1 Tax=Bosea rubneri TaxID=3075434 RepID=A0ABU3S1H9_9HYPH|nr:DUF4239 domain-containing protein [Bosea sp. ZW T0_25]MDU0338645.1 DUF4239 domain-containing protein [Bosea sp. ZW T0_25]
MTPFLVGAVAFLFIFGAAAGGMLLRARLPDHHLSPDSRELIKLATAIIGTLSAIALGLLIASAKRSFDEAASELRTSAAHVVLLDRTMAQYGPETAALRETLRKSLQARLSELRDQREGLLHEGLDVESIQNGLRRLVPANDGQRWLQTRALQLSSQISEMRWQRPETETGGFPGIFIIILVLWLALLFASFGLLAPGNATVVVTLFASALSVTAALVLIIDMDHPYLGFIRVSDLPLQLALERLGRA